MPDKDRHLRLPSTQAVAAEHRRQKVSGNYNSTISDDPIIGAIRAILAFFERADRNEQPRRGRPVSRGMLLRLLEIVEQNGWFIGEVFMPNPKGQKWKRRNGRRLGRPNGMRGVGTADKGNLAKAAAKHLHISPQRASDLLRQLAEIVALYRKP